MNVSRKLRFPIGFLELPFWKIILNPILKKGVEKINALRWAKCTVTDRHFLFSFIYLQASEETDEWEASFFWPPDNRKILKTIKWKMMPSCECRSTSGTFFFHFEHSGLSFLLLSAMIIETPDQLSDATLIFRMLQNW